MRVRKCWWLVGGLVVLVIAAAAGFWERPVEFFRESVYLREWMRGVENRTVTVDGYRVRYNAEGPKTGPPVLLIHGLSGRAEDWVNLVPYLVQAGYRVYTPDLPGYGRSEQPANFSYSVHDEAEIVVGFMDALALKQVELGGWSMGGAIVQHVAATHPARVSRLMLFDSAGIYELPKWDLRLFTPQNAGELDQLDALLMPHPPKVPGFIARDIIRVAKLNQWVVRHAIKEMITGKDATDALLPELKMPVLIVWGDQDKIMPLAQARKMHTLVPQSRLDIVPGCGHLAPGQCAGQVGPEVVEFLKQ